MIQIQAAGEEDIDYLVQNLEGFERLRAIRSGLKAAANVYQKKGKSNLRARLKGTGKGNLIKSFSTKLKRKKPGALTGFRISNQYIQYEHAGNHAHLVDRGTKKRTTKDGYNRGIMPANDFWTEAYITEQPKARQAVYDGIRKAVERINARV